jgi:aminomethyltransferase
MDVHNLGETLEVETDQSQIDKIAATFEHFIIMDDVEVTNVSDNWTSLGVAGPKSRELLTAAGILFPELQPLQLTTPDCNCDCGCLACTIVRGDSTSESYEIWLAPKDVYKTWQALISAGATPVGCESLEILRISVGTPVYGVDIRERDLPQETEQTRALNFNKGCYVGQEIVERIRSRGNVHRKFIGLLLERVETISPGAKIVVGEKEVGEVTSFAILPSITEEQAIALGYIRREAGMPGQKVEVGDAKVRATVIQLPMQSAYQQAAEDHVLNRA